jgi:Uma2 family endonuclease
MAVANAALQIERVSYEDFLEQADEDLYAEWVDGEVIPMSPASKQHQRLAGFLAALLTHFTEAHDLGEVYPAPFQMKTGPDLPGREPDALFVSREHLDRLLPTHLSGPADLVVEIVSPDSRGRDRGDKYYEYEQGGVREYWLIDPIRRHAEFYRLGDDGLFQPMAVTGGVFHSSVLDGLWLRLEWLWEEPPPSLMTVLREWKLL